MRKTTYIFREIPTNDFDEERYLAEGTYGVAVCANKADLFELIDASEDPFGFEFIELPEESYVIAGRNLADDSLDTLVLQGNRERSWQRFTENDMKEAFNLD